MTRKETEETTDDRQPGSHHAAPLGRLDRHARLGGTSSAYESRERAERQVRKGEPPHRPRRTRSRYLAPRLAS